MEASSHTVLFDIVTSPEILGLVAVAKQFGFSPFDVELTPTERACVHAEHHGRPTNEKRIRDEFDAPIPYEQRDWEAEFRSDGGEEPNMRAVHGQAHLHPMSLLTRVNGSGLTI